MTEHSDITTTGIEAVTAHLRAHHVAHRVVEHAPTSTAAAEGRVTHQPLDHVAKTVVLQSGTGFVLAIVPASERLDLAKVRDLLGAGRDLRLATEVEMATDFPGIEVGATPPVGPTIPLAEVVDERLMRHDEVLCTGGDHTHSILLDPREIVRLTGAKVADVCEEP